ncbi:MAG: metallophosphoesterase, partial [Rikenellaceae bacterium]
MKVFFVSDVHLGAGLDKAENDRIEQRFLAWLSEVHAQRGKLFLLGDIFDFWFEYKRVIPAAHSAVLGRLKEMTQDGIEIHFFKGNHDMWLRGYLRDEIGLIIHSRSEVMEIEGEMVFIGHGHDLG